ncbi:MAG: hypothetical protein V8T01_01135 [Oscillospiraceae bacterium]
MRLTPSAAEIVKKMIKAYEHNVE